ncbi:MAG: hypothetical protein AAGJ56_06920 [Myxococcota bacterium]
MKFSPTWLSLVCAGGWYGTSFPAEASINIVQNVLARSMLLENRSASGVLHVFRGDVSASDSTKLAVALNELFEAVEGDRALSDDTRTYFASIGLEVSTIEESGESWIALLERGPEFSGTGGYVFRRGAVEAEVLIQAPHTFHDLFTAPIAYDVFVETGVRAFFFNTIHRYRHETLQSAAVDHPGDLAHNNASFFHAMSTAYLTRHPTAVALQIHGFNNPRLQERGVRAVVSGGITSPTDTSILLTKALSNTFGEAVALYGEKVHSYGATTNSLSRWCAQHAIGQFLHLELDFEAREKFRDEPVELIDAVKRFVELDRARRDPTSDPAPDPKPERMRDAPVMVNVDDDDERRGADEKAVGEPDTKSDGDIEGGDRDEPAIAKSTKR